LVLFTWGLWTFKFESKVSLRLRMALFYCALIGCAHSAAAFLTYERFMSIGRHVLANPLPFFGLLIALQFVPERQDRRVRRALGFFVFASAIFLGMWWFRFAKDQWIG